VYRYVFIQFGHYLMPETAENPPCVPKSVVSVLVSVLSDQYSGGSVLVSVVSVLVSLLTNTQEIVYCYL